MWVSHVVARMHPKTALAIATATNAPALDPQPQTLSLNPVKLYTLNSLGLKLFEGFCSGKTTK